MELTTKTLSLAFIGSKQSQLFSSANCKWLHSHTQISVFNVILLCNDKAFHRVGIHLCQLGRSLCSLQG